MILITDKELFSIIEEVWTSFGSGQLAMGSLADARFAGSVVNGTVRIVGEIECAANVRCSRSIAESLAASMLASDVDTLSDGDVYDALGELTNMVGGGVKSLCAGNNALSTPVVTEFATQDEIAAGLGTQETRQVGVVALLNNQPIMLEVVSCKQQDPQALER